MQQKTMHILGTGEDAGLDIETHLSFKLFLDFLRSRLQNEDSLKREVFAFVLEKFEAYPELEGNVDPEGLHQYSLLLDLLRIVLSNVVEDEKKAFWGLCVPMSPVLIYGSAPFYELVEAANAFDLSEGKKSSQQDAFIKGKLENFYSDILRRFYGIQFFAKSGLVRSITDSSSGLTKHYSLSLNTDFVDIEPKEKLPVIDADLIRSQLHQSSDALPLLMKLLPADMFSFSGFTVITVTDVTQQHALDSIRNRIVENRFGAHHDVFPAIKESLQEMTGTREVEFNLLPLFRINGRMVDDFKTYCKSILFSEQGYDDYGRECCRTMLDKFVSNPELLFYSDLDAKGPSNKEVSEILGSAGVKAYALLPVFHNKNLVGTIELYSRKKNALNEKLLGSLDPARELIAQLMKNCLDAFRDEIEDIIKDKFTSLQPSVQWKFNEAAWRYLKSINENKQDAEPENIVFEKVFPLYGAVDIRNSTVERNAALLKDLAVQFEILIETLNALRKETGFMLLDDKIHASKKWAALVRAGSSRITAGTAIHEFLENEINVFLRQFVERRPYLQPFAEKYFNAINESTGIAHIHKRLLEESMRQIIAFTDSSIAGLRNEVQQVFPSFFEKFRTDGVEYDIYTGQSITPDKPYHDEYLKNMRLLQLSSMAAIAKQTHAMLPKLSVALQTTQLIFIHSNPIDIRFRRDEKRFDVEGAYNIRYHIIKKRIDKVRIKGTDERLTQPDKIALVYFSQREVEEYIDYISLLQEKNILDNDLELLELEDLQGVAGLKAMRVGVRMD